MHGGPAALFFNCCVIFLSGMHPFISTIICTCFLSLISCSHSIFENRKKPEESAEWAAKAIFEFLRQPNFFFDQLTGKGLTKLDPLLYRREEIRINGKVYFHDPMRSGLLKYPLPEIKQRLIIPDSLKNTYQYTGELKDYEHDYATILQFSPLLPTKEPDIYLMEFCTWGNTCHETGCVRLLSRSFLKFKTENQKVIFLNEYNGQSDFIGFGSFPRKQMEEAGPGDKITKYGW
ncbi:MAG: hypothetical protein EPGJADBJ_01001 [Saprospiraceae bacterium]|nr:hypothetical protein [Saprospiraceae bacterium]